MTDRLVSGQGYENRLVELATGREVIITMDLEPISWDTGGFSWAIGLADENNEDIEIEVHHSLLLEGDHWIPDPRTPHRKPWGDNECNRFNRMRLRNIGTDTVEIQLLAQARFSVEVQDTP